MLQAGIEPIDINVDVLFDGALSPRAQSAMLAEAAREELAAADAINRSALGRVLDHTTIVDGVEGASEDRVKPLGQIDYQFSYLGDLLVWIAEQLREHAPIGSGKDTHPGLYRESFDLYADGKLVDPTGEIPAASEYAFVNALPYSVKVEKRDGVFHAVADLARSTGRFDNQATIEFTYRGLIGLSSGSGTLVNPANDPTRGGPRARHRGRFVATGAKAYNKSDVRFPCIVVHLR